MNKIVLFLLSTTLLVGCKKTNDGFSIHYIKEMPPEVTLTAEKLPIEVLHPTGIVALDTFLILIQRHEEQILRVYSINSYQFLGSFLQKGEGPDEVQLFSRINQYGVENGEAKLWIQSYPTFMALLNVNQSLKQGKTVYDKKYLFIADRRRIFLESDIVFNLNDTTFLMQKNAVRSRLFEKNPNPFYIKYNYSTNKVSDTLYVNNWKKIQLTDMLIYSSYHTVKPDFSKVALFQTYMDAFTIIDLQTNKKYKYGLSENGLDPKKAIARKAHIHYEAFATDTFLFGLRKDDKGNSSLFICDWEGKGIAQWNLNANVMFFSINEPAKLLYCIDREDNILVYDLKDLI